MKKQIIKEYLKIIIIAVTASIVISGILCFVLFFLGRSADTDMPQYLVRNIKPHLAVSQSEVTLNEEGRERLKHHDVWLQVINGSGEVVFEENTKGDLPSKYSLIELTNAVLKSNRLGNYTVYMSDIPEADGYAVLLGCDSRLVTKYTYNATGEISLIIIGCILVISVVSGLAVLFSAIVFSKKITNPVGDIIEDIDKIRKEDNPPQQC